MPFYKITYSEKCRRATLHNWGCNSGPALTNGLFR